MKKIELENIVRPNIWKLQPYSCARTEYTGNASVFLDANENPYNSPVNRYPDPFQIAVKEKLEPIKGIRKEQVCFGNGSDETIDLMYRIFCEPGKDNVVAIDPTYGMYKVCADINNIEYRPVALNENYEFKAEDLLSKIDKQTKIIWICSPNNPTGNSMPKKEIEKVLNGFGGIVVIDEAYIDFSSRDSYLKELNNWGNLVILQTFSKAWGCAGLRLGMAFSSIEIIQLMNKVKYPYNINQLTQKKAIEILTNVEKKNEWVKILLKERKNLSEKIIKIPSVEKVYPTDANFILVKTKDANRIYEYLIGKGIIVRNRNNVSLCNGCLRITIGSPEENATLLQTMEQYK